MKDKLIVNINTNFRNAKRKVNLTFNNNINIGEITGLYGASGVGKSSLLKVISGLIIPNSGTITYNDKVWYSKLSKTHLPPKDRLVAVVFQDYNLFPNMTIKNNIIYASKSKSINDLAQRLITELKIDDFINEYPKNLSGGQKQRAAIIRAIAQESKTILMDEPFSALDDNITFQLINIIKELNLKHKLTFIISSHRKDLLKNLTNNIIHLKENETFK